MELRFISLLGILSFILIAWFLSAHRNLFPWRTVLTGLGLQCALALLILRTRLGQQIFELAQNTVDKLLGFANEGASMVFGPLANTSLLAEKWGPQNAFIFVITVTATIILVSSLSSLLYHYGILQRVVEGMARVMRQLMKTSGSESLAAAANIFMGQTEAPLVVKPYLPGMTRSELLALMTGGMASIAGGVLAAYAGFGISAGHLLTASVMSAPASLMLAKIILPETQVSETAAGASAKVPRETVNGLDSLCRGASEGMTLSINVMAMLIAFVAIVALANYLLALPQTWLGVEKPVTWEMLLGWVHAPFAWLIGIPASDCLSIGQVMGKRVVLNEFIGYLDLAALKGQVQPRSYVLASYALCGFANFSSIAIQIGGIGVLAPSRRNDLARLGLRAMIAGLLSCYLTAAIVGLLGAD